MKYIQNLLKYAPWVLFGLNATSTHAIQFEEVELNKLGRISRVSLSASGKIINCAYVSDSLELMLVKLSNGIPLESIKTGIVGGVDLRLSNIPDNLAFTTGVEAESIDRQYLGSGYWSPETGFIPTGGFNFIISDNGMHGAYEKSSRSHFYWNVSDGEQAVTTKPTDVVTGVSDNGVLIGYSRFRPQGSFTFEHELFTTSVSQGRSVLPIPDPGRMIPVGFSNSLDIIWLIDWEDGASTLYRYCEDRGLEEIYSGSGNFFSLKSSEEGNVGAFDFWNQITGNVEVYFYTENYGPIRIEQLAQAHGLLGASNWEIRSVEDISADGRALIGHGYNPDGVPSYWKISEIPDLPTPYFIRENGDLYLHFLGKLQHSQDLHEWLDLDPQPSSPMKLKTSGTRSFYRTRTAN